MRMHDQLIYPDYLLPALDLVDYVLINLANCRAHQLARPEFRPTFAPQASAMQRMQQHLKLRGIPKALSWGFTRCSVAPQAVPPFSLADGEAIQQEDALLGS